VILTYKLGGPDGHTPIPCKDTLEWGRWFENISNRTVAKTTIGRFLVSTVFLGLDHRVSGESLPVLFETMVFEESESKYQKRCCTWDEAVKQHEEAVEKFEKGD